MKLSEILSYVENIAKKQGIAKPFIVGGVPRDKVLGRESGFNDVDMTTGDGNAANLAKEVSLKFPFMSFELKGDGHASLTWDDIKLDFSSNFIIPGVKEIIENAGVKNIRPMHEELYSRDFTCNTLLMTLDLKKILDLSDQAIEDINQRKIKTCLTPDITIGKDPKRIVRAIYLASKLQFELDDKLRDWILNNPTYLFEKVNVDYISKKIIKSYAFDPERTVELLRELDLWDRLPASPGLMEIMQRHIL